MNRERYEFQWFDREDGRKKLRASVGKDGILRLGKGIRALLPEHIRVGFDQKHKLLAIAGGTDPDKSQTNQASTSARALSAAIRSAGLKLPLAFCLRKDAATGFYIGKIIPRRWKTDSGWAYDTEELLTIYQHIVDKVVYQMAKSTPIDERRAIVLEALVSSAQQYHSDDLDLEETLEKDMRSRLAEENRKYFPYFRTASLEQPIRSDGESKFSIADTIEASTLGGIDGVEERIMEEQFLECLTGRERRIYRMLLDGGKLSEIARQCGCSEADVERTAHSIGQKRQTFYDAA